VPQADLAIRNARIIDGTGSPAFEGDVGVREGRIESVGSAAPAAREIDAAGRTLTPGFVDTHTHDDAALLRYPGMEAPVSPGGSGIFGNLKPDWTDLASFFERCETQGVATNAVALVGHNTLRSQVVGNEDRAPTPDEIGRMRGLVEQSLEQGACGFSTGLIYTPGRYSTTEEVIELADPLAAHGALYATHMRNEGAKLLEAVDEALTIGREVGCPVQISHHKSAGRPNWGRVRDSLAKIDAANAEGADVTLDVYPYTAGSGPLAEYVNPERVPRAFAEIVRIASCPAFREFEGRMVPEIAEDLGIPPEEVVQRILAAPEGSKTICIHFTLAESDIETNLRHPRMMVGSDGIPDLRGRPHPRLFGTFPRVLAEYVRTRGILSLEEAVRRMTSLSCDRFGLVGRGRVREGDFADLVVFDPDRVHDRATYDEPKLEPSGIDLVVVNGEVTCEQGTHSGARAGRMLRYRS
jgi:N-acyl-D-amino-acid deacylase